MNMRPKIIIILFIGTAHSFREPCAEISTSWAAQATATFIHTYPAQVPAQLALDCLMSVPVDVDGDLKQTDQRTATFPTVSFHTQLPKRWALRQPQNRKPQRAFRFAGPFGRYCNIDQNDFEVQLALHTLFRHARDSHLRFLPDILEIFLFVKLESQLVSISGDGVALPHLYLLSDLDSARASVDFMPSSLSTINDKDATEYLEKLWTHNFYHDADARYNGFFPNPAAATVEMDSGGQFYPTQGLYDGPVTEFGSVNGSLLV